MLSFTSLTYTDSQVPSVVEEGRVLIQKKNPDWVRRYLSGSVYLFACGEKANYDDADLQISDGLIGWTILLVSGLAALYRLEEPLFSSADACWFSSWLSVVNVLKAPRLIGSSSYLTQQPIRKLLATLD